MTDDHPQSTIALTRLGEARQEASREAYSRMREDRAKISDPKQLELFNYVRSNLFNPSLSVSSAVSALHVDESTSADLGHVLGKPLVEYWEHLRIITAVPMVRKASFPTGKIAAAVGIPRLASFRRAYSMHTGERLVLFEAPDTLPADFNYATWYRLLRDDLSDDDIQALLDRLIDEPAKIPAVEADKIFVPAMAMTHGAKEIWIDAMRRCARRIHRDAATLPDQGARFLKFVAARLYDSKLRTNKVLKDARIGDTSIPSEIKFHFGDTSRVYYEKRRTELAIELLDRTTMPFVAVAEVVGFPHRASKAFQSRTGKLANEIRQWRPVLTGAPDFATWDKACAGELRTEEKLALCAFLESRLTTRAPARYPLAASTTVLVAPGNAESLTKVAAPIGPFTIEENDEEFDRIAHMLATENRHSRGRMEIEDLLISTPLSHSLHRLREAQCCVTAAFELQQGLAPDAELWSSYLRSKGGPDLEARRRVDERLTDSLVALSLWREMNDLRARTLQAGKSLVSALESLHVQPLCRAYVLGKTALDASFYHHRGTPVGLVEAEEAVALFTHLITHRSTEPPGLLVNALALSWARLANQHDLKGDMHAAKSALAPAITIMKCGRLDDFTTGQILYFWGAAILDEGTDLKLAEELLIGASEHYGNFDTHNAGVARILLASAERQRGKSCFLDTLLDAARDLEPKRDPRLMEVVQNNHLFYLVEKWRIREALQVRETLPFPSSPAHIGSRYTVEGCIFLAADLVERAEVSFLEAIQIFLNLKRSGDAMIAMIYLAAVFLRRDDRQAALSQLVTAERIARRGGYAIAGALVDLVKNVAEPDIETQIFIVAVSAGGCLGPKTENTR